MCPTPGATVTTAEVVARIKSAARESHATLVYLAHAGGGGDETAGEREAILEALGPPRPRAPSRSSRVRRREAEAAAAEAAALAADGAPGGALVARSASTAEAAAAALGADAAAALSPFELSLIEQEICASLADAFLPSALSTWSGTVTLDRRARGRRVLSEIDAPYRDLAPPFAS